MHESELQQIIHLSCLLEATARKAGNVHPGESFEHVDYDDFVRSSEVASPILARSAELGVGPAILEAVRATRAVCDHNTNLGIILLLAPLAAVPSDVRLSDGIGDVLNGLTHEDALAAFEAIRLANPRGLGSTSEQDVAESSPTGTLLEAMLPAADRDSIAAQYESGFRVVLWYGLPVLERRRGFGQRWEEAILFLQLQLMSRTPDTDIARKCGTMDTEESVRRAKAVVNARWPESLEGRSRFREFDRWLRAKGSRRNPGTTADLITASLFCGLREGLLERPSLSSVDDLAVAIVQKKAPPPGSPESNRTSS